MSVSILKSEKTVVFINSKEDVEKIVKNPTKNSLVLINGWKFDISSKEFKVINYFCAMARKLHNDVIWVQEGDSPRYITDLVSAQLEIHRLNEVD